MDAATTRGVSALPAVDGYHLRYVLGIYKQNEADGALTLIQRIPQTTPDFNLDLATDETFTLVAWADFVSSGTDNSTLTSVEDEFYNTIFAECQYHEREMDTEYSGTGCFLCEGC